MDQKTKLKIRIQKMLQNLAENYPPLIVEWRRKSPRKAADDLFKRRRLIGCTNVPDDEWRETAETAFRKWLAEHS